MLVIGSIIINKAGVFISGYNQKDKENISEIDMRATGKMVFVMVLVYFIMQMVQNIKDIGNKTWNKDIHFILIKMAKIH